MGDPFYNLHIYHIVYVWTAGINSEDDIPVA